MEPRNLKLGTRKSLLALAQSGWVARELERLNPGIKIELVGIETRGDVILDKPLSQIEGKEFFTAELDHALMRGDVDLTVHSMKDLSLDRPPQIRLGAVPPRELSHDVILFHDSVLDRIREGKPVRIGTSSPRRLTLIPAFLKEALPRFQSDREPALEFVQIRGNVNTRLSRVHEPEGSERKLDGVVLAFAGLERLTLDEKGSSELRALLSGVRMMILPLKPCPSAPAQGALAVEGRSSDGRVLEILSRLHHEPTLQAVREERAVLEEWGGGCHQKLGASRLPSGVLFVQGMKPDGTWVNETRGAKVPELSGFTKIDAADAFDFTPKSLDAGEEKALRESDLVFVAHSRAFFHLSDPTLLGPSGRKRIWVSGSKSWFKLAREGIWVEGSLDGQGFESFDSYRMKNLLKPERIAFLSHEESPAREGTVKIASYGHRFREVPPNFMKSESVYWSSGLPFEVLWSTLGPEIFSKKHHACGPGRTALVVSTALATIGLKPQILSME